MAVDDLSVLRDQLPQVFQERPRRPGGMKIGLSFPSMTRSSERAPSKQEIIERVYVKAQFSK
jgi:hypothetical protein